MKRLLTVTRVAALAASAASLLVLAGCGGGDNNDNDLLGALPKPGASPVASRYAGTYKSTVALPNGATGTTNITVAADGKATGTLTVSDTTRGRQATAFNVAAGIYAISGTVDPTTGAFTMSGVIAGQSFSYSGTFPAPGNGNVGGSYSLTYAGQTYTGSFTNPGSTTPNPNPTPTGGGGNTTGQGGTANFTFTNVSGATIDASALTSAPSFNGLRSAPTGTDIINLNLSGASSTGGKTRAVSVIVSKVGTLAVGDTFKLNPLQNGGGQVSYGENTNGNAAGVKLYMASSGTVTVVALSATSATLRVTDAGIEAPIGYPAAGTFTMNGEITATYK